MVRICLRALVLANGFAYTEYLFCVTLKKKCSLFIGVPGEQLN